MSTYVEFAAKLAANPKNTTIRTDMRHLHKVLDNLRTAAGHSPLADINGVTIVDGPGVQEGIGQLVQSAVMGVAMGNGEPFSDIIGSFHIADIRISISRRHAKPQRVSIDIELVHSNEQTDNIHFKNLVETLSCDQKHRNHC